MLKFKNKNKILDLSNPIVMGIINVTPNSFYNKGRSSDIDSIFKLAKEMVDNGAKILDIGGASTKPGEPLIDSNLEQERTIQIIELLRKSHPDIWLSIDTYNSDTAKEAILKGADIINDISSGKFDRNMLNTVAELGVPYIAMHIQGKPENMQISPTYNNVVQDVKNELANTIKRCIDSGIENVIIDPGFGFGKTLQHNYQLLSMLKVFTTLGYPVLAGVSRKSMICKPLGIEPEQALNGTTAINMVALMNGASILRVHDVKEAVETVRLFNEYNSIE